MTTTYWIQDSEAGNKIESFTTREDADKALAQYEADDIADDTYEDDFYEIIEVTE